MSKNCVRENDCGAVMSPSGDMQGADMFVRAFVIMGLGVLALSTGATAQTAEQKCQRGKALTGASVQSPKGLADKTINTTTPTDVQDGVGLLLRSFCNLPTMLPAHSGNKIKVVGPGFEKEFWMAAFKQGL